MTLSDTHYDFHDAFDALRDQLDEFHDRRERLIKASRDITNLSKKVIFLLHRAVLDTKPDGPKDLAKNPADSNSTNPQPHPPASSDADTTLTLYKRAASQGYAKLREVQSIYASLQPELAGDNFWRHQRQVSPGLQEYIEALSLAHYLDNGTLITFGEVQGTLRGEDGVEYFPLPISDYILGLADLTGELMRLAISGFARRGGRQKASEVCAFVRGCRSDFERMTPYIRELSKKQAVTIQSLEKIEDAAYAVVLRTSEYDLSPEMLDDIVAQSLSAYSTSGASRTRKDGGGGYASGGEDDA